MEHHLAPVHKDLESVAFVSSITNVRSYEASYQSEYLDCCLDFHILGDAGSNVNAFQIYFGVHQNQVRSTFVEYTTLCSFM